MTKEFGEELEKRRRAAGLTQVDLAKKAQVENTLISHLEAGRINTKPHTTIRIANALDIPLQSRAEFYLMAVGYPESVATKVINAVIEDSNARETLEKIRTLVSK